MAQNITSCDFQLQIRGDYQPRFEDKILSVMYDFDSSCNFHKSLEGYIASPLYDLKHLAQDLSVGKILCKNEAERFSVPAIKMLGASWAMHKILELNPDITTFCTATDGNHGRAVAWSAKQFKKKAIVFVPKYTVAFRIQNIKKEGAEVVVIEGTYDEAVIAAKEHSANKRYGLIQDTAWKEYMEIPALITSGYYTQMVELEKQTDNFKQKIDIVFLQTGNGSWPSAIAHYIRNHPNLANSKIVCVEPYESDCFLESVKNGKPSATQKSQITIMAGLNCGTPSLLAWEIMKNGTDVFLSIDDSYALQAMKAYYFPSGKDTQIEAGESGATGLAGLIAILSEPVLDKVKKSLGINNSSNILLFNTEGITDPGFFAKIIGNQFI